MPLANRLLAIRNSRWKAAVYIPLTVGLAILIFLGLAGFVIFLLPFFLFAIPYWFGERRIRRLAVVGPVVTLGVVASLALITTYLTFSASVGVQESPDGRLSGGMVSPTSGTPNSTPFNFTVVYNSKVTPAHAPTVNITSFGLSSFFPENHTMTQGEPTPNGSRYFYITPLDGSIHVYRFALQADDGAWVLTRDVKNGGVSSVGPFTASSFDFFSFFFVLYIFQSLLGLVLFFVILGLYAWHRRNQDRRRALIGGASKGTCPHCRAAVPEGATECPVCGKPVSEAKGQG